MRSSFGGKCIFYSIPLLKKSGPPRRRYDAQRVKLAGMFMDNFKRFTGPGVNDYTAFGPDWSVRPHRPRGFTGPK